MARAAVRHCEVRFRTHLDQPRGGTLELVGLIALGRKIQTLRLGGAALAATNVDPIAMLFWTAVINGVVAVPIMVAMMWVVSSRRGGMAITLPRWIKVLGWLAAALIALTVVLLIWSSVGSKT